MDVGQEAIIKEHKKRRQQKRIRLFIGSIITLACALVLILIYFYLNKDYYINYKESANVDCKTYLKENEFYEEEYLGLDRDVIASLIKNIEAEFNYEFNLEEKVECEYDYKIVAQVDVKEKNSTNSIYTSSKDLVSKEKEEINTAEIKINDNINIDYDTYNQEIKKFINIYDLDNTTSTLTINMCVNIYNKDNEEKINNNSKVLSLEIPLTTKTLDVNITSNVVENEGKVLISTSEYKNLAKIVLILGMILLTIGIITFIRLIMYVLETRSAERIYKAELRGILNNYKSYIQKVNNSMEIKDYEILKIGTFNEILEIRDTVQKPILMFQDENNLGTEFIVINDKVAFVYTLRASEIRERLKEEHRIKQENKIKK